MLIKLLFLLLYLVYGVLSINSFIEKGQRAKLFELLDNEVGTFKITLPDNEFSTLKEKVNFNIDYEEYGGDDPIEETKKTIKAYLKFIKRINFYEVFPGYNFTEILPELKIREDGYSHINLNQILNGFDYNPEHYNENEDITYDIMLSNPKFKLFHVFYVISNLDMSYNVAIDPFFDNLYIFKFVDFDELESVEQISEYINEIEEIEEEEENNFKIENESNQILPEFKTKNANLKVEINGEQIIFDEITLKLGGKNSRSYAKPGYNIKIRGNKDLYGRSQFKIRADGTEPTYLRTKLVSDIHNRLGLPSVSANYITLYINDEYMGLYILSDAYKPSWIESVYGEKNTTALYRCEELFDFYPINYSGCYNEDDDITDYKELNQFLKKVRTAKTVSDLDSIFEVDHFITEMAIEYLLGSWDHIQNQLSEHNFYLYKKPDNGKWIYLSYDFDLDFGMPNEKYINVPFKDYTKKDNIIKTLILKDSSHFEKILKDVVEKVFNPATLYPHIDELKQFIKPYVELDKTPNAEGQYPGRLNTKAKDFFSLKEWEDNSEFKKVKTNYSNTYGLKYWTLYRYRFVCQYYHMECDPTYMDENYKF